MFHKLTLVLFLLSSLLAAGTGCNPATNGQEPNYEADVPVVAQEDIGDLVDDDRPPPPPVEPVPDSTVPPNREPTAEEQTARDDEKLTDEELLRVLDSAQELTPLQPVLGAHSDGYVPPNPLAADPPDPQGLKGSSRADRSPKVYVNFYYLDGNQMSMTERARLKAWANRRGLTAAEANEPNFSYAVVRFVSWTRDKPTRSIIYDGNSQALLPTTVMVDHRGGDLRHEIGYINYHDLDFWYDSYSHKNTNRRISERPGGSSQAATKNGLPPETPPLPSAENQSGNTGEWTCENGRCYPNYRHGKRIR